MLTGINPKQDNKIFNIFCKARLIQVTNFWDIIQDILYHNRFIWLLIFNLCQKFNQLKITRFLLDLSKHQLNHIINFLSLPLIAQIIIF